MRKCFCLFAVALLSLLCIINADDVVQLTSSNFDEVTNGELVLVKAYAQWCGHCKRLKEPFMNAATALKDEGITFAEFDAEEFRDLAGKLGVRGYPTLKLFRQGQMSDFKGPRDEEGIIAYMKKQVGPSAKALETVEEMTSFLDNEDVSVVALISKENTVLFRKFKEVADTLRDEFRFAYSTNVDVLSAFGNDGEETQGIFLFHQFEGENKRSAVEFEGRSVASVLENWIYKYSVPKIGQLTQTNQARFQKQGLPIVKLYLDVNWQNRKSMKYYQNRVNKILPEFEGKVLFALVSNTEFQKEVEQFGEKKDLVIVVDDWKNDARYLFPDKKFNVNTFRDFVKDFLGGKIEKFVKSQPIPATPKEDDVTVVVAKNFEDIVLDETKDVLLEVYAPWCGHCKKLAPVYSDLARKMRKHGSVVIAKVDGTANDLPPAFKASGYPSLFFAPAHKKDSPMKYSGERDLGSFMKFIKENADMPLKVKKTKAPKDEL
eukprot:GCRY01001136.1.p1 GENE.GCRY01001136.1~~GCRY01001136.1.p1  ORF type:complete len:489 (+),score=109.92 GCRY01001136.1:105-1571(+)